MHGIYELSEETFEVCYMIVPKGGEYTRPKEYRTFPGSSRVYITFKRTPPAKEKAKLTDEAKPARPVNPALLKLKPGSLQGRSGPMRQELLKEGGGNDKTEAAVAAGLKWLVAQQRVDGSWTTERQTLAREIGATGLALLPLLGAGNTHKQGTYAKNVRNGLTYLLGKQKPDGSFGCSMYEQAIVAIAGCEAYGMSRDSKLKLPAQRAIDYSVAAQHEGGGWRYEPRQPGDTSVTGWHFMALKTGKMAGLKVPQDSTQRVANFLDGVAAADGGYGYQGPTSAPSCTAIGLLCRSYMGWRPEKVEMVKGIEILKKHPHPTGESRNIYHYYYATQAMRHLGGDGWSDWNAKVQEVIVPRQITPENASERGLAGSWSPAGDAFGKQGGRLMVTSLSLLTLEVYYRHVPLFLSEPTKGE